MKNSIEKIRKIMTIMIIICTTCWIVLWVLLTMTSLTSFYTGLPVSKSAIISICLIIFVICSIFEHRRKSRKEKIMNRYTVYSNTALLDRLYLIRGEIQDPYTSLQQREMLMGEMEEIKKELRMRGCTCEMENSTRTEQQLKNKENSHGT